MSSTPQSSHEEAVEELLTGMTLREKLGQCVIIEPCFCLAERRDEFGEEYADELDPKYLAKLLDEYKIGAFLFGGASRIGDGSASAWAGYIAAVSNYATSTRHQIPLLFGIDAVHGVNFMKGSTIYTHNLAVAATWNPELAQRYAATVGEELAAIGFNLNFAPTIDTARDLRWGRVYESLGEDPWLAKTMSAAMVSGMQRGGDLAACAKHFVGYGEARNGMDRTPADLSDRAILEMHVPPFEGAIAADVMTMMVNGGDVNGLPMPVSRRMLNDLLRDRLGFRGITLSDWEDVERLHSRHAVARSRKEAIVRAFNAGLDMNMAVCDIGAVDVMEEAVAEGGIPMERVDQAARNILLTKYRLGLFDRPSVDVAQAATRVGGVESREVARQLALQSITLLKNEGDILPLSGEIRSILVTGMAADRKRNLCGGWTLGWAGAAEEDLDCDTILGALRAALGDKTRVRYMDDIDALGGVVAEEFDVCINVVTEEPHSEWEGDSMTLGFEDAEEAMLRASVATGIPVVTVALIGRPLNLSWAAEHARAILWAYTPGTEGAGPIVDLLLGNANPSGSLPISFPRSAGQMPLVYNARSYQSGEIETRYEPLYEFGFGLSYSRFGYSDLQVPGTVSAGQDVEVSVTVTNISDRDGQHVVQLFLRDQYASVTRPLRSLQAFARVNLRAGQERRVTLLLRPENLSLYNEDLDFVQEPRTMDVLVGSLSAPLRIEV